MSKNLVLKIKDMDFFIIVINRVFLIFRNCLIFGNVVKLFSLLFLFVCMIIYWLLNFKVIRFNFFFLLEEDVSNLEI